MLSFADTDLNMLYYFLYPFLLPWQHIKLSLQFIFFDWDSADTTLQFFYWIKTFIPDFNKCWSCFFKIILYRPMLITFAWLWFFVFVNINDIPNFFFFIYDSIFDFFLGIIRSNGLCSSKSLLTFFLKAICLPNFISYPYLPILDKKSCQLIDCFIVLSISNWSLYL